MDEQTISQDKLVKQSSTPKKINGVSIDNLPDLLTVAEVADLLRVSKLTIKRWGKRGKLPAIRINARGDRRYRKEAVLWLSVFRPISFCRDVACNVSTT
jgi:excisionase family DNA binding protein